MNTNPGLESTSCTAGDRGGITTLCKVEDLKEAGL